jgi:hypothetical protein
MKALGAMVLYAIAAVAGLSVGYLATAPRGPEDPARSREALAAERHHRDEVSEMEAAAAFLAEQEREAARSAGYPGASL